METLCGTCGFRARTAQGLSGHRRLVHGNGSGQGHARSGSFLEDRQGSTSTEDAGDPEATLRRAVRKMVDALPDVLPEPEVFRRVGERLYDRIADVVADEFWAERGDALLEMTRDAIEEKLNDPEECRELLVMLVGRWKPPTD